MSDRDDLRGLQGDRIALANAIQDADIERAKLAAPSSIGSATTLRRKLI